MIDIELVIQLLMELREDYIETDVSYYMALDSAIELLEGIKK